MNRRLRGLALYAQRADELLADGKWHDGLPWMREVEKDIPAGVAQRRQEVIRRRVSRLEERARPLSIDTQVALGKRSITQALVHNRVRNGTYEVAPWPMIENGWKRGGWKVRLRPSEETVSLTTLEARYHVSLDRVRQLIMQDSPLRHLTTGRSIRLYETELVELGRRIDAYKDQRALRRKAAAQGRDLGEANVTALTRSELAARSGLAQKTVKSLLEDNPGLGWERVGRAVLLSADQLPAWDAIVEKYKEAASIRRGEATLRARASRRPEASP